MEHDFSLDQVVTPNPDEAPFKAPGKGCGVPGLYIHIPFCIKKCAYCGFFSVTDRSLIPAFLSALGREAAFYRGGWEEFDTLYIGGGTPSVLGAPDLERLLDGIRAAFRIATDAEITVEANPGDIDAGFLREIRRSGVNRLNIGCQSFDDNTLAFLGRRHTAGQAVEAVHLARWAGFENIGIDLIYGLPTSPVRDAFEVWLATLRAAVSLQPEHLSCYQLTLESGTPMAEMVAGGSLALPGEELQASYFLQTAEVLEAAGYVHYEVSNFSRGESFRSRHNTKYWDHTPYLGLGPAAHSFDGRRRRWNCPSLDTYLHELDTGRAPVAAAESLTPDQLSLETLFLGFRTQRGIDLDGYRGRYHLDLLSEKKMIIENLAKEGLVEIRNGFLRPTRAGMAVADSLALI